MPRSSFQLSIENTSFIKGLPEHVEIKCPVCLNIMTDPYLVSCCGHNFCGSCIGRVKASNESCPMCKEKEYIVVVNKGLLRIINGLEVYCSNKKDGCQWKGELKNMSTHLKKRKRKGECQYEEVKCQNRKCRERKQRRYLKDHENDECPQRPFQCQYCGEEGTFLSITKDHYENNECPLEPVDCVFSWTGCNDKPLRKDVHVHTADTKHMTLLAVACGQLKKENEQLKEEMRENNDKIKKRTDEENAKMKQEIEKIKKDMEEKYAKIKEEMKQEQAELKDPIFHAIADHPLLPIVIERKSDPVHFYTGVGEYGVHMSAILKGGNKGHGQEDIFVLLAFHEGKFEKFRPRLPQIFAKVEEKKIPLIADTRAFYRQLPHDALNGIKKCDDKDTVPKGVLKIKLGRHQIFPFRIMSVKIYTE